MLMKLFIFFVCAWSACVRVCVCIYIYIYISQIAKSVTYCKLYYTLCYILCWTSAVTKHDLPLQCW